MAKKQQQSQSTGNSCSCSGKSATAVTVTTITVAADTVDKNNCSGMETAAVTTTAFIATAVAKKQSRWQQQEHNRSHNYCSHSGQRATTVARQQLQPQLTCNNCPFRLTKQLGATEAADGVAAVKQLLEYTLSVEALCDGVCANDAEEDEVEPSGDPCSDSCSSICGECSTNQRSRAARQGRARQGTTQRKN